MIARTIAGCGVVEIDRAGRRYVYPPDYPNIERIEASIELSASHDDGDVEGLKVDPDRYPAQDAYFSTGSAQSPDFVKSMAEVIDPRFDGLVERVLSEDHSIAMLRRVGDHLADGGNVINAVPHGPLLDIGLLHAMAYIGLARLGYEVRIGIVISHGVAGRGKRFKDDLVCLADALDWACDKVWYVTPQTSKTRQSSYSTVVSEEHVRQRNAVVRDDIGREQDSGGILITVAPSATSNRVDPDGVHWMERPTLGTLRLMSHPKTRIAIATGRILGAASPSYAISDDLIQLAGDAAALTAGGDEIMARMVADMRALDPASTYDVGRAGRPAATSPA